MGNAKSYENYKKEVIAIKNKRFKIIGIIITLICFLFIAKIILAMDVDLSVISNKENVWWEVILLFFLGIGCLCLVAYGWSEIVEFIEPKNVNNIRLASIYIKTNIAKYLPGNVINLVGRNVLAGELGFKQISIATSTIIEIIIFGSTSMILAFLFSITRFKYIYMIVQKYVNYKCIQISIIAGILVFICIAIYMANTKKKFINNIKKYFTVKFFKLTIKLVFLYSIFFIFLGAVLAVIIGNVLNISINFGDSFEIIGFYIISYFIGYITPGAPGGMGIRETVLILLLTPIIGRDLATIASIIHRIITIAVDVVSYCINCFFEKMKLPFSD